jgi:hypothetical protein
VWCHNKMVCECVTTLKLKLKKKQLKCCHIINTIITKESDIPKESPIPTSKSDMKISSWHKLHTTSYNPLSIIASNINNTTVYPYRNVTKNVRKPPCLSSVLTLGTLHIYTYSLGQSPSFVFLCNGVLMAQL